MDWVEYLFSFNGRLNRAKYWLSIAIFLGAGVAAFLVIAIGGAALSTVPAGSPLREATLVIGVTVAVPFVIALLVASVAIYVKRLHDRNRSGWWIIPFSVVPGILRELADQGGNAGLPTALLGVCALISAGLSIWAFIEVGCLRGTVGSNRYGTDPLGGVSTEVAQVFE